MVAEMSKQFDPGVSGRVESLHLHPSESGAPLQAVMALETVAQNGIRGNGRYFGRISRSTGKPSRRQISLMEREQIADHAASLGLGAIPPGAVRANIETLGIDLVALIGQKVAIGEAILYFHEPRKPCSKMDALCAGLRQLMEGNRQGVLAEVIRPGRISIGDPIHLVPEGTDLSG
ncbi:MAG: domain containing protein [Pedosphaera sp.]|nr:domain containing protein [Pedosphaera sp.]